MMIIWLTLGYQTVACDERSSSDKDELQNFFPVCSFTFVSHVEYWVLSRTDDMSVYMIWTYI